MQVPGRRSSPQATDRVKARAYEFLQISNEADTVQSSAQKRRPPLGDLHRAGRRERDADIHSGHRTACSRCGQQLSAQNQGIMFEAGAVLGFRQASTPMISLSFMMRSSSPSSLISVPDHFPNRTRSPTLRSMGISLPVSSRPPGPIPMISPSEGFSLAVSGMMMPPLVFACASIRLTTTRSCSGRSLDLDIAVPFAGLYFRKDWHSQAGPMRECSVPARTNEDP